MPDNLEQIDVTGRPNTSPDWNLDATAVEDLTGSRGSGKGANGKESNSKGMVRDGRELHDELMSLAKLSPWIGRHHKLIKLQESQMKLDLATSFAHAYKQGGQKAVQKLADDINHEQDAGLPGNIFGRTNAKKPYVIPIVDKQTPAEVQIHRMFELTQTEARLAAVMSAEQLNKLKIRKHECASGYVQTRGDVIIVGSNNPKGQ